MNALRRRATPASTAPSPHSSNSDSLDEFVELLASSAERSASAESLKRSFPVQFRIGGRALKSIHEEVRRTERAVVVVIVAVPVVADTVVQSETLRGVTLPRLTRRERQVAELLVHRRSNAEIAESLGVSSHTARHHVQRVLDKLGIRSRRDVRLG